MEVADVRVGKWQRIIGLILAVLIPLIILMWPKYHLPTANRCFALLIGVIVLWISNAIPLFVTALLIPCFGVIGRIMLDHDGELLSAPAALHLLLSEMIGTVLPVMMATLTIAACYLRYRLPLGNNLNTLSPPSLLLSIMLISLTLCFGLSNTSCAIFAYMLLGHQLTGQLDNRVAKALLMGICVACNIGGYLSPVSSGQSVFIFTLARKAGLEIGWWQWIRVTIPCAYLSVIVGWVYLVWYYKLNHVKKASLIPDLEDSNEEGEVMAGWKMYTVIATTVITVVLWATSSLTENVLGGMGTIAFFPVVILFGLEILSTADLRLIQWDFLLFMMGALALVQVVQNSGLLLELTKHLTDTLGPLSPYVKIWVISFALFIASTVKSHTIAGLVFMPMVVTYIAGEGTIAPAALMASTIATSIGMALQFSGIVNMAMMGAVDGDGNHILSQGDFLKVAGPISLISYIISTFLTLFLI